jgi:general secretion pathway protein C
MNKKWVLRLVTALVWALAAGAAVYWGLRLSSPAAVAVADAAPAVLAGDAAARQASIARFLGAQPAALAGPGPGPADRFALIGVVASVGGEGAALVSVDGKPARPFAVGMQMAPGYVLQSLGPREARLSTDLQAPVNLVLSLPAPKTGLTVPAPVPGGPAAPGAAPASAPPNTPAAASAANGPVPMTGATTAPGGARSGHDRD